jgi:predicted phosphodiesterase
MNRREVIVSLAAVPTIVGSAKLMRVDGIQRKGSYSIDDIHVRFFNPDIKERFTIIFLADTHLFRDDQRGDAYKAYSGRMAKAYNQTRHFKTNEPTNPEACFEKTLEIAKKENAKLLVLAGDIFSFPSEAAIEWVLDKLKAFGLPYVYTAGNHDWHYEGMQGTAAQLRETWIQKRLFPLYQNENPMMAMREIHNVRLLTIDNSDYQITRAQLDFFRKAIADGKPVLLMMHIPVFAQERPVSYGCGHPEWGAKADRNFELERRERWPEAGHNAITQKFYREVLETPNLLGILAGHIHKQSLDVLNGLPQIVTHSNAHGAYLKVEFVPADK